jgi:hypothetical protein
MILWLMLLLRLLFVDAILVFRRLLVDAVNAQNMPPGFLTLRLAYPWLNAKRRWLSKRLAKLVAI